MKKMRIFWNFEQEEAWLREMASAGHIMQKYSMWGIYTFTKGAPQPLNYKIDYKMFSKRADYESYLALFEDAGWRHVCGTQYSGSQYFLPQTPQANSEIFSDAPSANQRYQTLFFICLFNVAVMVTVLLANIATWNSTFPNIIFLTPGLWDKVGVEFWKSFLFELPFALGRFGFWILLLIPIVLYGYWAVRAKREYDAHCKKLEEQE